MFYFAGALQVQACVCIGQSALIAVTGVHLALFLLLVLLLALVCMREKKLHERPIRQVTHHAIPTFLILFFALVLLGLALARSFL
jgi:hypothetical protein